jgi:ABC-type multidrug transport system fused ATPase/permease subunit
MRGTARENILFGLPFDAAWYRITVEACALDRDFSDWPSGDLAEIGDRGRAVSGGQQARLSLARVVYARPKLCLIDDPFAALDAATRAHVWDKAVRGCLSDAAVVLATSSAALAIKADRVIVLRKGRVVQHGAPAALGAVDGPFADLLAEASESAPVATKAERPAPAQGGATASTPSLGRPRGGELRAGLSERAHIAPTTDSQLANGGVVAGSGFNTVAAGAASVARAGEADAKASLDENERRSIASSAADGPDQPQNGDTPHCVRARADLDAAWAVEGCRAERAQNSAWGGYAAAFGGRGAVFGLAVWLFVLSQASIVLADCWLARWSSLPQAEKADLSTNLGGLAALAALAALFVTLQAGSWSLLALNASNRYQSAALRAVLHAPLSALSVLPVRRVVSRFSRDVDALDVALPGAAAQALTCLAALLSSLAAVLFATPLALPVVAAVVVVFGRVVHTYRPTAADARRLVSVLHGPVLSHILESLDGRVYIRAFGQSAGFEQQAAVLVEAYAHAQVFNIALQRWLALRLEMLGAWMLLAVALLAVATRQRAALGPAGLALTYALTFTGLAKYLINYATKAFAQLASVERLTAIADLPDEFARPKSDGLPTAKHNPQQRGSDGRSGGRSLPAAQAVEDSEFPPANWPRRGELRMVGYSPAAYLPTGRCVLQPTTLTIHPGQHVVLIGRSGAGKSTIVAGITRLLPPATGQLFVDGYEARDVGLARWRSALACIPQEPVLLAGSISFNLDISGAQPEKSLWEALRLSGLEMRVRALSDGLDTPVDQAGLSGGERQGIVLARLLLRRAEARLVLLDEPAAATAEADSARLHGVLHERFAHAALIAVSHTALPFLHLFSRLLVLADGTVVEDGPPDLLLNTPASRLSAIFSEAPPRLQAHVGRMIALQRSRGLPAVRGLWRSAHSMSSEFLPVGDGAAEARGETDCASGDKSGMQGAPLCSCSGDGAEGAYAPKSGVLGGGGGSRSVCFAGAEPEEEQDPPEQGLHARSDQKRSTDDRHSLKGPGAGGAAYEWPLDLSNDPYGRDHQDGEGERASKPDASPTCGWAGKDCSSVARFPTHAPARHDVRRRGGHQPSSPARSLSWTLPVRFKPIAAGAPQPITQPVDTAKLTAGGVFVGPGGRVIPWAVLGGVPSASEAETSSTIAAPTAPAGSHDSS